MAVPLYSAVSTPVCRQPPARRSAVAWRFARQRAWSVLSDLHLADLPAPLPDARAARYSLGAVAEARAEVPGAQGGDEDTCTGPLTRARIIWTLGPAKFS